MTRLQEVETRNVVRNIETSDPTLTNSQIFWVFAHWIVWILVGASVLRFAADTVYDAWWMVLGLFWLSVSFVRPLYRLPPHVQPFGIALANVAIGMVICWTFCWFMQILDGWSLSESIGWLRTESEPLRAVFASVLTTLIFLRPIRRVLGDFSLSFLFTAALWTGVINFAPALISVDHWRQHWLGGCLDLFETIVLPMVMVAMAQRKCVSSMFSGALTARIGCLSYGDMNLRTVFFVVYPLTLGSFLLLLKLQSHISRSAYTAWQYANLWAAERILTIAVLLVGSVITWRALATAEANGTQWTRHLQAIVAIIAGILVLNTTYSDGFAIGSIITDSTAAALGGNYRLLVDDQGDEIRFSGLITYGLSGRLTEVLAAHPGVRRIRLKSQGGSVQEAAEAAQVIAANELDTIVSNECVSSCILMFVAGKTRTLTGKGRLGFHDTHPPGPIGARQSNHGFRPYFEFYGIEADFITRIEIEHSTEIWFPTRDELLAANVLSTPQVSQ